MIVRELTPAACAELLRESRVGRLACSRDDRPYVVPIYYAYADGCAHAFTMPGRKLEMMRANPHVALLVEHHGEGRAWRSVVASGRFEELPDRIGHKQQRDRAWSLLSRHAGWWEPGALKPVVPPLSDRSAHVFFCIRFEEMTGREALEE